MRTKVNEVTPHGANLVSHHIQLKRPPAILRDCGVDNSVPLSDGLARKKVKYTEAEHRTTTGCENNEHYASGQCGRGCDDSVRKQPSYSKILMCVLVVM